MCFYVLSTQSVIGHLLYTSIVDLGWGGESEERQPTVPSPEKQHSALFGDTEEIHHLKGAGKRYHLSKCAMV